MSEYLPGLLMTAVTGGLFWRLRRVSGWGWINPLLFSVLTIIVLLTLLTIPYETYAKGASLIHAFLGPLTVVLAVPLYEHREALYAHRYAIFLGTFTGSFLALFAVWLFGHAVDLQRLYIASLMPKSTTTPIGILLNDMLGGLTGVSVLSIVITGVGGAYMAPVLFRVLKIRSDIAKGVALGAISHAIGTAKAYELSPLAGAMAAVSIAVSGLFSLMWVVLFTLFY